MIKREIMLDEESDKILDSLAEQYGGDISRVVCELLQIHGIRESDVDAAEQIHSESLLRQKQRSENEFRERKVVAWSELKRQCGL